MIKSWLKAFAVIPAMLYLVCFQLSANEFFGGEITWTCLAHDSFLVKVTRYRDCNYAAFDTISLQVKGDISGQVFSTIRIAPPAGMDITPLCSKYTCSRCSDINCPFPFGIEKYEYTAIIDLSNAQSCCMIVLSHTDCCRSNFISTGLAGKSFSITSKLNRCLDPCDNSPKFTNLPLIYACVGKEVHYNVGIVDNDVYMGNPDSVACELVAPRDSANSPLTFDVPYSYDKPVHFSGFPDKNLPFPQGFHFDAATGQLDFKPDELQSTSYALKLKIYKNKTQVAEVIRDMYLMVFSCPDNIQPSLHADTTYKEVCAGDSVFFHITTFDGDSLDTLNIKWNNTIPGATWTTNNGTVRHPSAFFVWKPDTALASDVPYEFIVIVRDNNCPFSGMISTHFLIKVKKCPASVNLPYNRLFNLFPNPASAMITIEPPCRIKHPLQVEILDMIGQPVYSQIYPQGYESITISIQQNKLANGLYYIRLCSGTHSEVHKLLIAR